MNKASFLSLVREASRISETDTEALEQLVVNFPYCQTAHLLIAKAAYDRGSMLSNQKLKKAAIYATNRQLLKKLIYTSDATVSLHPLSAAETAGHMPEKVNSPDNADTNLPATTAGQPEVKNISPEGKEAEASETNPPMLPETAIEAGEAVITEARRDGALSEDFEEISEEPAEPISEKAAEALEIEIPKAVILAEEVAIAEAFSEERASEEIPDPEATSRTDATGAAETEKESREETTESIQIPEPAILAEEVAIADSIPEVKEATGTQAATNASEPKEGSDLVQEAAAAARESIGSTAEIEIPEEAILAEEVAIAETVLTAKEPENALPGPVLPESTGTNEASSGEAPEKTEKLPDFHELPANPETSLQDITEMHELQLTLEAQPVPFKVTATHDDLLQETLASFDQYLFRPEKETVETAASEDLKVVYPVNEIDAIYYRDTIGYWMSSSRLGESLQVKNDLTSAKPFDFHPELLLEYTKTHELEKQIKPAPNALARQLDIIDQFLKLSPRLKAGATVKIRTEAQEDLSQKSTKINKNLASENFANILVQQGKIKKAIKIYEHLILKIPEKKAYFVAQIEKLQNQE